jgi:hypothetical protein
VGSTSPSLRPLGPFAVGSTSPSLRRLVKIGGSRDGLIRPKLMLFGPKLSLSRHFSPILSTALTFFLGL